MRDGKRSFKKGVIEKIFVNKAIVITDLDLIKKIDDSYIYRIKNRSTNFSLPAQ